MNRPMLLIVEPEGASRAALETVSGEMELVLGPFTRDELIDRAREATGLWVRLAHRIDGPVLEAADKLAFVASATTGLNHIDLEAATRAGVQVLSLKGEREFLEGIHATAEHTWGLLLALLRKVPAAHASVLRGEWDRDRFRGGELHAKSLGIVGCGRIGSKVAGYGRAFGMRVLAVDTSSGVPVGVVATDLRGVVAEADVLSIHVDYRPETRGLIDTAILETVKPGCLIINTARGEILDEQALLAGLRSGRIGGAALDVLRRENAEGSAASDAEELLAYARTRDNLILSPHLGGATVESMEKTEVFIAQKILEFLRSKRGA